LFGEHTNKTLYAEKNDFKKIPTITIQSNLSKNLNTSIFFPAFSQILLEIPTHKRYNRNPLTKPNQLKNKRTKRTVGNEAKDNEIL
jgi:hypothetical protein